MFCPRGSSVSGCRLGRSRTTLTTWGASSRGISLPGANEVTPARDVRLLERDAELAALGSFWAKALVGRGRFVFPGGEGGAGKTSVGLEFGNQAAGRGRFLVGACDVGA